MTNTITTATHPVDVITEMYDSDTLHKIAMQGCDKGAAFNHTLPEQCVEFFDAHEFVITDYIEENLGYESAFELAVECKSTQEIKQHLTWIFIELIATSYED